MTQCPPRFSKYFLPTDDLHPSFPLHVCINIYMATCMHAKLHIDLIIMQTQHFFNIHTQPASNKWYQETALSDMIKNCWYNNRTYNTNIQNGDVQTEANYFYQKKKGLIKNRVLKILTWLYVTNLYMLTLKSLAHFLYSATSQIANMPPMQL